MARLLGNLKIARVDWFALAVYPLSGGFKVWILIPRSMVHRALRVERRAEGLLGRFAGFRMMLVIEKTAGS